MEPNIQQPNNVPLPPKDYFMSPDLPPIPDAPQPKSKVKLIIILAVIFLVLLIAITLFVALIQKPTSTKQTITPTVTQDFLTKVANEEFDDAYKMIEVSGTPNKDKTVETIGYMNYLKKNYPVNECVTTADSTTTQVIYTCKNSSNKTVTVQFSLNNESRITAFNLTKEQSE